MSEPSDSIPSPPPPTSVFPTAQTPTPPPGFPPNPVYTPYQSYGYPYPNPYPPMGMPVPPQMLPKGMAITGMVLGIVGLVTSLFYGGVLGVIGLVFSIVALRSAARGQAGGRGMAIAGLVTSILAILVTAAEIVLVVWFIHTVSNCNQYNPNTNPNGSYTQYDQCVRQGVLGN